MDIENVNLMGLPKTWVIRKGCVDEAKHHLIDVINDGDVEIVIHKKWLRTKQRWSYEATPRWAMNIDLKYAEYNLS